MRWMFLCIAVCGSLAWYADHRGAAIIAFCAAGVTLLVLEKLLDDATTDFIRTYQSKLASLTSVVLANISTLIIIFVAVRDNHTTMARAMILGSVMGNILLVMGAAAFFGCRKHTPIKFNAHTASLFMNQLFLVGATLSLPSIFRSSIPEARQMAFCGILSLMLLGVYAVFYLYAPSDERIQEIQRQARALNHRWSRFVNIAIIAGASFGIYLMSEVLIKDITFVADSLHLSPLFMGFVVLPLVGNLGQHMSAVRAARLGKGELSLSIAIGSASQAGMMAAPAAVVFGFLTGNHVNLHFNELPLAALALSVTAGNMVLRDNQWQKFEGIMLLAFYVGLVIAFAFTG